MIAAHDREHYRDHEDPKTRRKPVVFFFVVLRDLRAFVVAFGLT
jgi:hypothetical protein